MIGMKEKREGDVRLTLSIRGEVAGKDSERFAQRIDELVEDGIKEIVIDLRNSNFMDSAGLGTLAYTHVTLQKKRRKMSVLVEPESFMHNLFDKTKLCQVLTILTAEADI